ncbi:MAG TPA: hypothetical protein VIQ79_31440, partial [Kribbella sp.]
MNTAVDPGARVTEAGVTVNAMALDSGALTVRPAVMVPLTFVPVPWTVSVADPVGVPDVVLTVSVVLAVPPDVSVTEVGLRDADAFAGTPVALSAT